MLTRKEYEITIGNLNRCCLTHSLPFVWDSKNNILIPGNSKLNNFVSITTIFVYLICIPNSILGTLQMYHESKDHGKTLPGEFFIGIVYSFGFIILLSFHINFVINKNGIAHFFNSLMQFNLYYDPEVHVLRNSVSFKESAQTSIKELILFAVAYLIYVATITVSGIAITGVDLPFFLYSNIPLECRGAISFCLVAIFELYYHFRASQTFVTVLFFQVNWISSATSWLKIIWQRKSLSLAQRIRIHSALSILQTKFYESFLRVPNTGMQLFMLMLIILGNYGTLRLFDKIHPLAYAFFPWASFYFHVTMVGACNLASKIHDLSSTFLEHGGYTICGNAAGNSESVGSSTLDPSSLFKTGLRLRRSRKPLEFKISQFFPIRKCTLMILLYWSTTHTVNLLLLSP